MFCNKCGAPMKEDQKFCASCGAEKLILVSAMQPSTEMPASAQPVPWATKGIKITMWVVGGFVLISILAVVLASLNTARQKGNEAQQKTMGATAIEQTDGWQSYSSVVDSFSTVFPVYPTYNSTTYTSAKVPYSYHTYKAVKGQTSFEIFKYIFQSEIDVSDSDALLQRLLNGFVNGTVKGTLASSTYTYVGEYRALDFQIDTSDNENVKGRLVLVGQTPYLIGIDYFPQNYNDADYQKFISSFNVSTTPDDEQAKHVETTRMKLAVNPVDAVSYVRSLPAEEGDRVLGMLTDEEYAKYEEGK